MSDARGGAGLAKVRCRMNAAVGGGAAGPGWPTGAR